MMDKTESQKIEESLEREDRFFRNWQQSHGDPWTPYEPAWPDNYDPRDDS